jgi:septum formation topological specificity factor MinE
MSRSNTNEAMRQLLVAKQREEHAKMRLCDDMQRDAVTINNKATHYGKDMLFFNSVKNWTRMQEAAIQHVCSLEIRGDTITSDLAAQEVMIC